MGVAVFGHWGLPLLAFPTSHGDEWEIHRHGLIDAIGEFIDGGRVKVFCVGSNNHESFLNNAAHPLHRSWRQRVFDEYIRDEVVPFIYASCQTPGIPISTMGASLGGYHAANTLFRYPHMIKRCYALSGVYDLKRFDPWLLGQLATCEIRLVTGSGPWEESRFSYEMSGVLARKGIRHHLDDWGPRGGHDWPYWTEQMRAYLGGW